MVTFSFHAGAYRFWLMGFSPCRCSTFQLAWYAVCSSQSQRIDSLTFFRKVFSGQKKKDEHFCSSFVLALPIFPVRLQTSIFGRSELNFRVRNGNGWTLALINTNLLSLPSFQQQVFYQILTQLSSLLLEVLLAYLFFQEKISGDPYGNRTHVCGVRGRRLNRLTNGPDGAPSRIRTGDPLIKSQLLYQLS